MGKKPTISIEKRILVSNMLKEGFSAQEIIRIAEISHSSVTRIKNKVENNLSLASNHRTNKKRITSNAQDRIIGKVLRENRHENRAKILEILSTYEIEISQRTLTRRMKEQGFGYRSYTKKFLVTDRMMRSRYKWCKTYKNWTVEQWKLVAFSDESTIELGMDRKQLVIRRIGEKYHLNCIKKLVKFPVKVMFWGFITAQGTGSLVPCFGTVDQHKYIEILKNHLLPQIPNHFRRSQKWIFQQDNATCHTAKSVKEFMKQKKIRLLDWPGNAPDFAPIENVWTVWKDEVAKIQPRTKQQLIEVAKNVWHESERVKIAAINAIESVPRRIQSGLQAKGGATKY